MNSLVAEYIDHFYSNLHFSKCKFSSYPCNSILKQPRRSSSLGNRFSRNQLYLTAASMPSQSQRQIASIEQSQLEPTVNQPLYSVIRHIDAKEPVINKTMDSIENEGLERYITKTQSAASKNEQNRLDDPACSQNISSNVVSSNEVKAKPLVTKRSTLLPIIDHQVKKAKHRRKK